MSDEPRRWLLLEERGDKSFVGPTLVGGMGDEAAQKEVIEAAPILAERDSLKAELEQERTNRNEQMDGRLRILAAKCEQMLDLLYRFHTLYRHMKTANEPEALAINGKAKALLEQAGRTQPKEAEQ